MIALSNPAMILPLLFFFSLLSLSEPLQYLTLIPRPLPFPKPLKWDLDSKMLAHPISEDTENMTLTLELHHIDSLIVSHANITAEELFKRRLQRNVNRVEALYGIVAAKKNCTHHRRKPVRGFRSSVITGQGNATGEYFTRIGIGTPARQSYLILDTGSDIVWIQCKPCTICYKQPDPIFDPKKSSTFSRVACDSKLCLKVQPYACNEHNNCLYSVSYGDRSSTRGELSTETLMFGRYRVRNTALGCGHDNEGLFAGADGLIGLGRGPLSFPSQAGHRFDYKFSYCLLDQSASSKPSSIIFGKSPISRKTVFTPLISDPLNDSFYYVELTGISVGGHLVTGISPSTFKIDDQGYGGVIMDSGTTVTGFTESTYDAVRKAFRTAASHLKMTSSSSTIFDTCYDLHGVSDVKVPAMAFHFKGAIVELSTSNILIPIDKIGTYCFAFANYQDFSIIGNIQQQGFRIVYDLAKSRIGFSKDDCA